MEDIGGTGGGGGAGGGTIGHVRDLMVSRRQGEAVHLLGTDRSGGECRQIDQRTVLEEADEVVAGAATVKVTETAAEATPTTEGEWEDPPETRVIGQD